MEAHGSDKVICACNDQSSYTLRNAQSLQVCTLSSSKFCLTIDFTFIDGLCIVQVSKIDTTEEAPVRLTQDINVSISAIIL